MNHFLVVILALPLPYLTFAQTAHGEYQTLVCEDGASVQGIDLELGDVGGNFQVGLSILIVTCRCSHSSFINNTCSNRSWSNVLMARSRRAPNSAPVLRRKLGLTCMSAPSQSDSKTATAQPSPVTRRPSQICSSSPEMCMEMM